MRCLKARGVKRYASHGMSRGRALGAICTKASLFCDTRELVLGTERPCVQLPEPEGSSNVLHQHT
jgi:hypothetical protein